MQESSKLNESLSTPYAEALKSYREQPIIYDNLALQVGQDIEGMIPTQFRNLVSRFEIHPHIFDTREGNYTYVKGTTISDIKEIHLMLSFPTILHTADSINAPKSSLVPTYERVIDLLGTHLPQISSFRKKLMRQLKAKPTDFTYMWNRVRYLNLYMHPAHTKKASEANNPEMETFMTKILAPALAEDPLCGELIFAELRTVYAHEYGHVLFEHLFHLGEILAPTDRNHIEKIANEVMKRYVNDISVSTIMAENLYDENPKKFVNDSLRLNQSLINAISTSLSPELRERFLHFVVLNGLNEVFARAFSEALTGHPDRFYESIAAYTQLFTQYTRGDETISEIRVRLEREGIENAQEIIESLRAKSEKELKNANEL